MHIITSYYSLADGLAEHRNQAVETAFSLPMFTTLQWIESFSLPASRGRWMLRSSRYGFNPCSNTGCLQAEAVEAEVVEAVGEESVG